KSRLLARGGCGGSSTGSRSTAESAAGSRGLDARRVSRRGNAVAVGVNEADLHIPPVRELEGVGEAQVLARTIRVQFNLVRIANREQAPVRQAYAAQAVRPHRLGAPLLHRPVR